MKIEMYQPISEAIKIWLTGYIKSCQPRLCSEFSNIDNNALFQIVLNALLAWESSFFLISISEDDLRKTKIVDQVSLGEILLMYFKGGVTVSILDPTNGSGCTIDWEGFEENSEGSEVLVVAWGEHESIAQILVDKFGSGAVFRGN